MFKTLVLYGSRPFFTCEWLLIPTQLVKLG